MNNTDLNAILLDNIGDEEELQKIVQFENPDYANAVIGISDGVTHDDRTVYDFDKMVECLMNQDNMSEEEAIEFIEYNTIRALPYASGITGSTQTPIIMRTLIGLNN